MESADGDRIAGFDLNLMQFERERFEIPVQHYQATALLPSAEFQRICSDLQEFGETIQVHASKNGITSSVHGDDWGGNVLLKTRVAAKVEDRVAVFVGEPVTATFALRYLVHFAGAAPLSGCVELGLSPDAPLLVKYNLETRENGFMKFYLSPKNDDAMDAT